MTKSCLVNIATSLMIISVMLGCSKGQEMNKLEFDPQEVSAAYSGGVADISYTSLQDLTDVVMEAVPEQDWIDSFDFTTSGKIIFNVKANYLKEKRQNSVSVYADNRLLGSFLVVQDPYAETVYTLSVQDVTFDSAIVKVQADKSAYNYFIWIYDEAAYDANSVSQDMIERYNNPENGDYVGSGEKEWTFGGLNEDSGYVVCLMSLDPGEDGRVVTCNVRTGLKESNMVVDYFEFVYWGDYYGNGTGNFFVTVGNADIENGVIASDGEILMLSALVEWKGEDYYPLGVEEFVGTYKFDSSTLPGTIGALEGNESYLNIVTGDATQSQRIDLTSASLDIYEEGGQYKAKIRALREDGKEIVVNYDGEIAFSDESFHGYDGPQIDADMEMDCTFMKSAVYQGVNGDLDYYLIDFLEDPDPDNPYGGTNKNAIRLEMYLPLSASPLDKLRDGEYKISKEKLSEGAIMAGDYIQMGVGTYGPVGSYYNKFELPSFVTTYGFFESGTVTIENRESETVIMVNAVTDKGFNVDAVYHGSFDISSMAFNEKASAQRKRCCQVE